MNILEARRRLLDGEIKKRTAEGENISVRSVSRMRPALTLYGKSEQETTTGAQLFDFANSFESYEVDGFVVKNNGDGSFDVIGKAPGYLNIKTVVTELSPGTYYINNNSKNKQSSFVFQVIAYKGEERNFYYDQSFEVDGTETSIEINARIAGAINGVNDTVYPMLNAGSTALPFEPYTGGAPSPSPDYPQEIKSVGDIGTVNVTLSDGGSQSQTLPVQTPNGLPGIPVSSDGNYTDANGQQWVCDEVDFKRGVYVSKTVIAQNLIFREKGNYPAGESRLFFASVDGVTSGSYDYNASPRELCNIMPENTNALNTDITGFYAAYDGIWARIQGVSDLVEFNEKMKDAIFLVIRDIPVETPLSPSDLAAYAALRTYSPTTVVSNDAGAWMKLGYKTKKSLEVTD